MDTPSQPEPQIQPKPRLPAKKQEKKMLNLNVPEKLFILAIEDDQGIVLTSVKPTLRYGLACALLAELALATKIHLEGGHLALVNLALYSDALFDDILAKLAAEKNQVSWIRSCSKFRLASNSPDRNTEDGA